MSIDARYMWDVKVPMRDGVKLSADIFLPLDGEGPYPTIFYRTPYNNQHPLYLGHTKRYVAEGYAVVLQDCRGRNDSEGEFYPFHYEFEDGYDSVQWIAEQPWCDGKIGMNGASYDGWVQWAAAREGAPLTTMISCCPGGLWMEEVPYNNGLMQLFMFSWHNLTGGRANQPNAFVDWERVMWHLPLRELDSVLGREVPAWQDWLDHPTLDEYWTRSRFTPDDFAKIDIPVLHLTGWHDGDQLSTLHFYDGMREHSPASADQHILIGPWGHGGPWVGTLGVDKPGFPLNSIVDSDDLHIRWFDHWLKGIDKGLASEPRAKYFYTGSNEWRDGEAWPPRTTDLDLYLRSAGAANTVAGDGRLSTDPASDEPPDALDYDPLDPASSLVGMNIFTRTPGSVDGRLTNESRDDVLVYTTDPLEDPVRVSGTPRITLHASSDRRDTDWVVNIGDVNPQREVRYLGYGGLLRARYRKSLSEETLLEPGEIYAFTFNLWPIGHVFKAGHRIRIQVTSSAFPLYDRNQNTGNPIGDDAETLVAHNVICHDAAHASHITLPIEPA